MSRSSGRGPTPYLPSFMVDQDDQLYEDDSQDNSHSQGNHNYNNEEHYQVDDGPDVTQQQYQVDQEPSQEQHEVDEEAHWMEDYDYGY